jgi:hypothetical protein
MNQPNCEKCGAYAAINCTIDGCPLRPELNSVDALDFTPEELRNMTHREFEEKHLGYDTRAGEQSYGNYQLSDRPRPEPPIEQTVEGEVLLPCPFFNSDELLQARDWLRERGIFNNTDAKGSAIDVLLAQYGHCLTAQVAAYKEALAELVEATFEHDSSNAGISGRLYAARQMAREVLEKK